MRHKVSNRFMPGVESENVTPELGEMIRQEIFYNNVYLGTVVYVRQKLTRGGSNYGWRPAKNKRVKLSTKRGAIERLPHYTYRDAYSGTEND